MNLCFISVLSLLISLEASALQKQEVFHISNPKLFAHEVEKTFGPRPLSLERRDKNYMVDLKQKHQAEFNRLRHDAENNSELRQSFFEEVEEASHEKNFYDSGYNRQGKDLYENYMEDTPIDIARKIAKKQMFLIVQKNWPLLKDSIFNEEGVDNWKKESHVDVIFKKLDAWLIYTPRNRSDQFLFNFGQWGFVEIDRKTLKVGRAALDVNSTHDGNTLVPEARDLVSDDAPSTKTVPEPGTPSN